MRDFLQDLAQTLRRLARSPTFAIFAVLTLALGIGANTAVFSLINAVLLRPPAEVAEPDRLVALYTSDYSGPAYGGSAYPDVEDFGRERSLFDGVAAFSLSQASIGAGETPERTAMEVVTPSYFQVLGTRPELGRFFTADETVPGNTAVVISYGLWTRYFQRDPRVIGRELPLNGGRFTVIGVAPEGYTGRMRGLAVDVWATMTAAAPVGLAPENLDHRGARMLSVFARLRPGVGVAQAESGARVLAARMYAAYPDYWGDLNDQGRRITVLPEAASRVPPQVRGPILGFVGLMMGTMGVVLLICCANVAGLVLARSTARSREIAIRASLGATRRRLVGQMLMESLVLAVVGAALGLSCTLWLVDLANLIELPVPVRFALDVRPDLRVWIFTTAVTAGTALLFGLAPALRASRVDLSTVLKNTVVTFGRNRRFTLRNILVVGQISMSMLLLVGSILFLRSVQRAATSDLGFRTENLLTVKLATRPGRENVDQIQGPLAIREQLAALPGVTSVTWAATPPLGLESASRRSVSVEGYQPKQGEDMEYHFNVVGPDYFRTMRIELQRGRDFTLSDREGAAGVAVVNEEFARRFWPGEDPLTKRISASGPEAGWLQVVGVTRTGKYVSVNEPPRPFFYLAALQEPWGTTFLVRTASAPAPFVPLVRRVVETAAPDWTVEDARTMQQVVGASLLPQRLAMGVLGASGAVALLLAAIGLYGVVAFTVAQRTREIGVRMALGARSRDVLRLVVGQGLGLVAVGVGIGLPIAYVIARLLSSMLLGGSAWDPITFGGSALLVSVVAILASYLPARRAARLDPRTALQAE